MLKFKKKKKGQEKLGVSRVNHCQTASFMQGNKTSSHTPKQSYS